MSFDSKQHRRKSIRLATYDYSRPGFYFITVCAYRNLPVFGEIIDGNMEVSCIGKIVADTWLWLSEQYPYVHLHDYVVMPNHFHGILEICGDDACRGGSRAAPTRAAPTVKRVKPLGGLIGAFKTVSTKQINQYFDTVGKPVWQRNYYEHVIRNESSYLQIAEYIRNNPMQWQLDKYYVGRGVL